MDARPLVVHVIFRLDYGGLENGLVNLLNRMPAEELRHAVVCLAGYTEFRARLARRDIEVYSLEKRPGKDFRMYGRFFALLRRLRPSVVHTRNLGTVDLQWVAWAARVPCRVHGEHGWDAADPDGLGRKNVRIRRACRHVVERYVALSNDLVRWLREVVQVRPERIVQIYNGVDTERFSPAGPGPRDIPESHRRAPGRVVFGTVGRLDPVKSQSSLIEATALLAARLPQGRETVRTIIAGKGSLADELRAQASRLGVADLIWFTGARDDVPNIMRAMDVFVLPSVNEGISNTLLEAMATALPAVATRVGGNPELIISGRTGVLYEPSDQHALLEAMQAYITDPALRQAHGEAARARALERFSLAEMVNRYFELYRELCFNPAQRVSAAPR